ncbi:MAG: tyrosine--tRNA ligase [Christensenellales bacterium]|jgi:tyrosyl-tRNA synthetase
MNSVYDVLKERGFIAQVTHEEELRKLFETEQVTYYVGFDPTADSLHVGHFIPVMAMAHLQRAGHRPIALVGGGTGMVGDPSGKADMRQMLTTEAIDHNAARIKEQLSRFLDFSEGRALMVNNADWLRKLNYIEFLRDVGTHFSVNRMLGADCFKIRMEKDAGLSFLEFNYMIMQSYDFLRLYSDYGCKLQMGGDDQWSNILSGADLIRRKEQGQAYGLTFALLVNNQGVKMGKTVAGALWLDGQKTSPYDFYQYWRNVEDDMVEKCLALLTFLPMDEVRRLGALEGAEINEAKKILAFKVTEVVHGTDEARKARQAAEALFGGGGDDESIPTVELTREEFDENRRIIDLLVVAGLCRSKGEARRNVQGGGVSVNDQKVDSIDFMVEGAPGADIMLRRGKKNHRRVRIKE